MINAIIDWYTNMHFIANAWLQESPTAYYLLMLSGVAVGVMARDFCEVADRLFHKIREED